MTHPDNEPGKTYDVDDRRRAAVLSACEGLPTEWLERGFVKKLYSAVAVFALADKLGDRRGGSIVFPLRWWEDDVRAEFDMLNNIAAPGRIQ